jgi:hypothetical protein
MPQALVVRCAFEPTLSSIGARSGNPVNVGTCSDDDLIPLFRFGKFPRRM